MTYCVFKKAKLMNLCKLHNIYILNGRYGTDKYISKVTSKDCSLIDYAIGTNHVFKNVTAFQICDFDPLLSDIHCALILTYSCKYTTDPNNPVFYSNGVRREIARKWVPSKCEDFINNIDDNIIENISLILDESINKKARVTIETDNIC